MALFGVRYPDQDQEKHRMPWEELLESITGVDPRICPYCGKGRMIRKQVLNLSTLALPP
jgi:uncharacterized protein (DUF983 family)